MHALNVSGQHQLAIEKKRGAKKKRAASLRAHEADAQEVELAPAALPTLDGSIGGFEEHRSFAACSLKAQDVDALKHHLTRLEQVKMAVVCATVKDEPLQDLRRCARQARVHLNAPCTQAYLSRLPEAIAADHSLSFGLGRRRASVLPTQQL